jgi:hypothetical protein
MAEFLITAPDGKKYKVTGATREGALAALKKKLGAIPAAPVTPQYDSFGDLVKQRGQQFAQGATEAFASLPEAAAIAGAGNPNAGANVVSETVQKAKEDLAALEKDYAERVAAYKEANRQVPAELNRRYQDEQFRLREMIAGAVPGRGVGPKGLPSNEAYLRAVTNGGEVNLKPDAQDRDLFKAGDALRKTSEDVFGAPQPNDQSFWAQVAQGGGTVAGMIAQGPFALGAGAGMNSSQLYKEAKLAGATEEDAKRAAELGAWVGTTEIVPITRALKLLPPRLRKEVGSKFWKKVSDIAQSSGEEAAQEYAQTVANNLIAQNIYDPERGWNEGAAESALVGAVIGGGVGTIGVTINNSLYTDEGSLKKPEDLDNTQQQAAGDLARTFKAITDANPDWSLTDIDKTSATGARAVVDTAHVQLTEALKQRFADMKSRVKPNQADTFESVSEKILAQAAYREGRNKTKNLVGNQELEALKSLAGDTREGQEAINLILQLNQLTELHNSGYQGGLSAFTDQFSILGSKVGYDKSAVATERLLRPIISGGAAVSTGGLSIPAQMAVSGGGRAIDKLTGNYSQIDKFVRRNAETPGLPSPTAPSLRDAAAAQLQADEDAKLREEALRTAREAEQRELNLQLVQEGAPATPGSPQYTLEDATGLSRDGVARILRILKAQNKNPALTRAIADYEQSVATGGIVEDKMLSPLIRAVRQFQQDNPDYVPMVRPPNSLSNPMLANAAAPGQAPNVDTTEANPVQAQTFGPQLTTQENYNRGIEANQAMNAELVEGVTADPELNRVQKGRLITSLDVLANNLGSDPVAAAQEQVQKLEEAGVPQEAIDTYVKPYVDRVTRQQASRVSPDEPMLPDVDPTSDPSAPQNPALQSYVNPLQVPENEIDATRLNSSPSEAEIQKMREGTYKPKQKRTLVEAADYMYEKWKAATGRDEPFEYTPENVDIISTYMATEAVNALQSDANAIGWYDRKLKAAKRVVSLVDPRVTQSPDAEVAFDFALAITSNGQAVADNFQYALEVFRHFMDNGQMPTTTWKKGGKRNAAMVEAFEFFNDYQASGTNLPIQEFLDQDFTVKELKDWAASFNERYGTNITVPSSEGANEMVKGSFIAGPKIGQGFYQNIRGNYDPLTMDIWWMRMWNRLVGRPFVSEKDLDVNRARVRKALQTKNQDALEKRLTKETLKDMGLTRADLKKDAVLDDFVLNFARKYQSFYNKEAKRLKGTGQKVPKPELALATGTMKDNLSPQLQATPSGPGERSYMRDVTKAAIAKLRDLGYNIETADFQALMWYPEKQLFRHLGVAPGRGADNDYLDAAIMLAEAEGITNDQIQEALPDADGDGTVNNQSDPSGAYENSNRGASGDGPSTEGPSEPILRDTSPGANPDGPRPDVIPAEKPQVTAEQYKKAVVELIRPQFQIGLKGGELEDGISNFNDAVEFAKKLGIVVRLAMSQNELNTLLYLDTGRDQSTMGTFRGMFQRKGPKKQGKGTEGTIWAMKPGADKGDGTYVTDIEALTTLLHEISHAITLGPLDGKSEQEIYSYFINRKQSSKPGTGILGRSDFTAPGSFTDSAIKPLLDANWEQMSPTQKKAYAEIVDLQENVEAYSPKNPNERRAVRFIRQVMSNPEYSQETKQAYKDYTRMAAEFAVDPVWVYLINPKLAKKLMPVTSKMIQQEFRKANNTVIQFYAHPLAVVMAALVALEMAMDDEEERKQQQMPPGALNQPMMPGALSA